MWRLVGSCVPVSWPAFSILAYTVIQPSIQHLRYLHAAWPMTAQQQSIDINQAFEFTGYQIIARAAVASELHCRKVYIPLTM